MTAEQHQEPQRVQETPNAESSQAATSEVREKLKKNEKKKPSNETGTDEYDDEEDVQTEEEKINELVRKMLASGVSTDTLEKRLHTDGKMKLKNQGPGKGRGRGANRGKK